MADDAVRERGRQVAALFDSVAATYDTVGVPWFTPIAERLVDELDVRSGEHVLDAGCGRGAALPALSAAVGRAGRIVGVDVSGGMVEQARRALQLRELHNVEVHHTDATATSFAPDSFSVVNSSLVLFFLADPVAALRHWRHLLVPTGRVGISTFGERDSEFVELDALFAPYLPGGRTEGPFQPGSVFSTDAGVAGLLADAGFERIRTVNWTHEVTLDSPDRWKSFTLSTGMRARWAAVPDDEHDALLERAAAILQRRNGAGRPSTLGQAVRMTIGYRPRV